MPAPAARLGGAATASSHLRAGRSDNGFNGTSSLIPLHHLPDPVEPDLREDTVPQDWPSQPNVPAVQIRME